MNENIINELLKEKYGDFELLRLTGGYTNQTFLLKNGNHHIVVKTASAFNEDVRNERKCLSLIEETSIAPKVYDFIRTDSFQIMVMEYREGRNGQSILDNHELERTKELYKVLGASLAKNIHSQKYQGSSGINRGN